MKRIEASPRALWDNIKSTNIRIIGLLEEKEKNIGSEKFFEEIIARSLPKMRKEESIKSNKCREFHTR